MQAVTEDSGLHRASVQTERLEGSRFPAVGARAAGEQPQKIPMEICLPRIDSWRKHVQRDFLFGSNMQSAPQACNVLEALLRQGVLDFLQCFETEREQETNRNQRIS